MKAPRFRAGSSAPRPEGEATNAARLSPPVLPVLPCLPVTTTLHLTNAQTPAANPCHCLSWLLLIACSALELGRHAGLHCGQEKKAAGASVRSASCLHRPPSHCAGTAKTHAVRRRERSGGVFPGRGTLDIPEQTPFTRPAPCVREKPNRKGRTRADRHLLTGTRPRPCATPPHARTTLSWWTDRR